MRAGSILSAGLVLNNRIPFQWAGKHFPVVRTRENKRNFKSAAIENAISVFKSKTKDKELGWLFENCFPNTLDTTVFYEEKKGKPYTYVITGDIDAMWLRDSSAQVYPYISFAVQDKALHQLIAGVINKQVHFILKDPYANAFYNDENHVGEWVTDHTEMKPGVHERKFELDSLCYPIRLAYNFWKQTGDITPFDAKWKESVISILKVCKDQQRKDTVGPYSFRRTSEWAIDAVPNMGTGATVKPIGLICSVFRPSDDATIFPFLIPSNMFAVVSLRQAAEMVSKINGDHKLSEELLGIADEVDMAVKKHAIAVNPKYGKIYPFEIDGFGSQLLMDDSNVPSLLSLPYLSAVAVNDPVYQTTRKFILSKENPYFFSGKFGEGTGGPHIGKDMIWPMSVIMQAMTSVNDSEISNCIKMLQSTHAGTGFMHESFHKDDPSKFTRKWFAWANTLFGELLWKTLQEKPYLL